MVTLGPVEAVLELETPAVETKGFKAEEVGARAFPPPPCPPVTPPTTGKLPK